MAEHLGYDRHDAAGRNGGNSRNGKRAKTVLTDACGEVGIEVPRDRDGSFDPVIVRKRQRRSMERLLTVEEAAEVLNTSTRFPRRLIAERRIRFVRVGRHVRIPPSAIEE
jgi:excisionase family DNA binding protein